MPLPQTTKKSKTESILTSAKKRGYISQDEILAAFPQPENHIQELDSLYDQLIKKEVDIFETVEEEKDNQRSMDDLEKELEALNIIQGATPTAHSENIPIRISQQKIH